MSAIANKMGNERQLAQIDGETGRYLGEGFDDAHLNFAAAVQPASSSPPPNLRQRCDHLTVEASTCVYRMYGPPPVCKWIRASWSQTSLR
jgi:hypothetical protein